MEDYLKRQTEWYKHRGVSDPATHARETLEAWYTFMDSRNGADKEIRYDEDSREVEVLTYSLLGHRAVENAYDLAVGRIRFPQSPTDYWESKRPYGNKDVPCSILFKLGWGSAHMREGWIPDFIQEEALRIHRLVDIEREENNL